MARRVLGLSAIVLAATVAACTDSTGPNDTDAARRRSGYLTASASVQRLDNIKLNLLYPALGTQIPLIAVKADTVVQRFTLNPKTGSIVVLGLLTQHIIAIPANALCNPATSTYGPSEWLKPCALATAPITFTAKTWKDRDGRPHADFQPAVRFTPDSTKSVRLFFQDLTLANYSGAYIAYCNASNVCQNEGVNDPQLETHASPLTGGGFWIFRKLRHFSGYNVAAH